MGASRVVECAHYRHLQIISSFLPIKSAVIVWTTKMKPAQLMDTSHTQIDLILDPTSGDVTIETARASQTLPKIDFYVQVQVDRIYNL
jgi:hypothetical protein